MKILFLFLLLPSISFAQLASITGIEGIDYVVVDGSTVTLKMVWIAPDITEIIIEKDSKFGYVLKKEIKSNLLKASVIIEEIYKPFIRNEELVGRWYQGRTVTIKKGL